jgi:Flp pilus assembly protein TadG
MTFGVTGKIRSDRAGAGAAEFALTIPIVATLLTGTIMVGNYLSVRNSLKSALDETSRYATINPEPSDSDLENELKSKLMPPMDRNKLTLNIKRESVTTAVKKVKIEARYPVSVVFLFAKAGTIEAEAEREIFLAN